MTLQVNHTIAKLGLGRNALNDKEGFVIAEMLKTSRSLATLNLKNYNFAGSARVKVVVA